MDDSYLEQYPADLFNLDLKAYRKKITDEMAVLMEKINVVAVQPRTEEIWCTIGDINFGDPITPLILRYRALMWYFHNPPDPRGEKMFCRPSPYTIFVPRADLAEILPFGIHTIDRMLADVRESLGVKPYTKIRMDVFYELCNLPETEIQQQLYELRKSRYENPKHKK